MSKLSYLTVKNISKDKAEIYFYGEIVGDEWDKWTSTDTCPQDVIDALKEAKDKDLDIYINSPGGNVFAGIAIYNILKRYKGEKIVHVDGVAASIASVIAMSGDKILMPSNAFLMIHNPINCISGNSQDFRKAAEELDIIQKGIVQIYQDNLKEGADIADVIQKMDGETWMQAEAAAQYFNVTLEDASTAAAKISPEVAKTFRNAPKNLIQAEEKENTPPPKEEQPKNEVKEKLLLELELISI